MSRADPTPEDPARGRDRARGHAALVAVQVCFGSFPILGKLAFEAFDPFAIAGWRIVVGGAALLACAAAVHRRRAIPAARDLPRLVACALLGVVFNQVLFLEGLSRSTAVNAGLLMPLIPVYTFLIAVVVRQERFSPVRALGIAIAFAATIQLLFQRETDLSRPYLLGNVLIAVNAFSYSCFLVVSRPLLRRYPPLVVIAWVYVLSIPSVPVFTSLAGGVDFFPGGASTGTWTSLVLILVFPTFIGYLLNVYALAHLSASTTAFYVYLQPLIAGGAGVAFLNESLGAGTLLAAVGIFAGLALIVVRPGRGPGAPSASPP